jgi:hypothetical protein
MAMAFIPLAGSVGGGIDMPRLTVVKSRLQPATRSPPWSGGHPVDILKSAPLLNQSSGLQGSCKELLESGRNIIIGRHCLHQRRTVDAQ